MPKIKFLNIYIDNLSMEEVVEEINEMISKRKISYIVTPNVDHIVKLETDAELQKIYKEADLVLTDGMPLIWISKLKGNPIKEKISGSDLFPKVCELAAKQHYSIFLLGASKGVAERAAEVLKSKYQGLNIAGTYSPSYGFENNKKEIDFIIDKIRRCQPDILAVGLGAPKQEKFIYKYKELLNVPVSLAIGATIDFEAGHVKRAPLWMQKSGLEWFYRLCKEPKRMFKRYLIDDIKIVKIIWEYR